MAKVVVYNYFGAFLVEAENDFEELVLQSVCKPVASSSKRFWVPHTQEGLEILKNYKIEGVSQNILLKDFELLDIELPDFLREYQKQDVRLMVTLLNRNFGVINANAMGTGKTLIALATAKALGVENILILSPQSVKKQWVAEAKRFNLDLKIDAEHNWAVVNYEKLYSKGFEWIFERKWDLVICDEAHKLKNPRAKRTRLFNKISKRHVILLTGTPIYNKPEDFFNLLKICSPLRFKNFLNDYAFKYFEVTTRNIHTKSKTLKIYEIFGIVDRKGLMFDIKDIYTRKEREEVLDELPDVIREQRVVELTREELKYYDRVLQELVSQIQNKGWKPQIALLKMLRLRQVVLSPALLYPEYKKLSTKFQELQDIVEETDDQIVVFTTFKKAVELACSQIPDARGIHGDLNIKERFRIIEDFQKGNFKVLVATPYVAGEGLNLQNANVVVFLDRDYTPSMNEQAEARVIRMGQRKAVVIYDIVAENTIDQAILDMLETKRSIRDDIVLTREKLLELAKGNSKILS